MSAPFATFSSHYPITQETMWSLITFPTHALIHVTSVIKHLLPRATIQCTDQENTGLIKSEKKKFNVKVVKSQKKEFLDW